MKCIAAYYGYYESPSKIWGLDFRFGELPQPAVRAFKDLKERFQWISSNPNETYGDCYALWPVDQDQVLAVRFRDMGRDQVQDRLHPIRIEVALVTREMCPNWPIGLATMLSAVAWEASNTVNDPTYIQLNSSVEPPQISDKISEALSSRKIPSVFYSTHTNGAPNSNQDGFDIIQMPSREIVKRPLVNHMLNKSSVQPDQRRSVRRSVIYYILGLLKSNALGVTIGAVSIYFILLQPTASNLNKEIGRAKKDLETEKEIVKDLSTKLEKTTSTVSTYEINHRKWLEIMEKAKELEMTDPLTVEFVITSIRMRTGSTYSSKEKKIGDISERESKLERSANSFKDEIDKSVKALFERINQNRK